MSEKIIKIPRESLLRDPFEVLGDGEREEKARADAAEAALTAIEASRARVRASFQHREADGACGCVYCQRDADGLAEQAAEYEMRAFSAEQRIAALTADVACLTAERARLDKMLAGCGTAVQQKDQDNSLLRHKLDDTKCRADALEQKLQAAEEARDSARRECDRLDNITHDLRAGRDDIRNLLRERDAFLEAEGYRRCDTPACNCGSWHNHRPAFQKLSALISAVTAVRDAMYVERNWVNVEPWLTRLSSALAKATETPEDGR